MGARERNYLVGCLGASALFGWLAYYLIHKTYWWAGPVAGALSFLAGLVFEPVREGLKSIVKDFPSPRCHVMLFGPVGNGKTQVYRCLRNLPYRHGEDSTTEFAADPFFLRVGQDKSQTKFRVVVADYPGQEPYAVLGDIAPKQFFGDRYARKIDVVFFIVDLFPIRSSASKKQIDDDALVELCKTEGQELIEDRVKENLEYYHKYQLQNVFAKVWSQKHRPYGIRLLINKMDILVDAVKAGCISLPSGMLPGDYALHLYSSLIENLKDNCDAFNIPFFSEPISVKEDNGKLRGLLIEILEKRLRKEV